METSGIQRRVKASEISLDHLSSNHNIPEQEKVKEVSRQFEAVLLRQILTEANKPMLGTPLIRNSATNSIYQDMITSQLAEQISQSGSFGLAKSLSHQLGHELRALQDKPPVAAENLSKQSGQIK